VRETSVLRVILVTLQHFLINVDSTEMKIIQDNCIHHILNIM
jgi:hypothetical protein